MGSIPDSVVELLGSVGGANDDDALGAVRDAVKLDEELGLEAAAGLVLAGRTLGQDAVDLVYEDDGRLHLRRHPEQHPHLQQRMDPNSHCMLFHDSTHHWACNALSQGTGHKCMPPPPGGPALMSTASGMAAG